MRTKLVVNISVALFLVQSFYAMEQESHLLKTLKELFSQHPYPDVNAKRGYTVGGYTLGRPLLHEAMYRDDIDAANFLLDRLHARTEIADRVGNYPLHIAIKNESYPMIKILLEHSESVDFKDDSGRTPLHHALLSEMWQAVALLLPKTKNINAQDTNGRTPLHLAVTGKSVPLQIIELLLKAKARIDIPDSKEQTVRSLVKNSANPELMELFRTYVKEEDLENRVEKTVLECMLENKDENGVTRILCKENVNKPCSDGKSPLYLAMHLGLKDIAQRLVDNGADVNIIGPRGCSLLQQAIEDNDDRFVHNLLRHGANVRVDCEDPAKGSILHIALKNEQYMLAEKLLEAGADVNCVDADGNTPLHLAIMAKRFYIVEALLKKDIDVNIPNATGDTPLHIAMQLRTSDIAKALLKKDINVNIPNAAGDTPLHIAVRPGGSSIVRMLLKKDIDVNIPNAAGDTPLHMAVQLEKFSILKALLEKGAQVNIENTAGDMPLHIAASKRAYYIVDDLLKHGADVNALNRTWNTPLHLAAKNMDYDTIYVLEKADANVNIKNIDNQTAYDVWEKESDPFEQYIDKEGNGQVKTLKMIVDMLPSNAPVDVQTIEIQKGEQVHICYVLSNRTTRRKRFLISQHIADEDADSFFRNIFMASGLLPAPETTPEDLQDQEEHASSLPYSAPSTRVKAIISRLLPAIIKKHLPTSLTNWLEKDVQEAPAAQPESADSDSILQSPDPGPIQQTEPAITENVSPPGQPEPPQSRTPQKKGVAVSRESLAASKDSDPVQSLSTLVFLKAHTKKLVCLGVGVCLVGMLTAAICQSSLAFKSMCYRGISVLSIIINSIGKRFNKACDRIHWPFKKYA